MFRRNHGISLCSLCLCKHATDRWKTTALERRGRSWRTALDEISPRCDTQSPGMRYGSADMRNMSAWLSVAHRRCRKEVGEA